MLKLKDQMEGIYRNINPDEIPWNIKTPPKILKDLVLSGKIEPCKVIELGCGTGNYVMYLANSGFEATGVDFSETAVSMARRESASMKLDCTFIAADVLGELSEIVDVYDFLYDWELLHHIFPEDREKYFENVYRILKPGGRYLSVCFSEESPQFGGTGKYRETPLGTVLYFSSEKELEKLFEKYFEIEEINTVEIDGKYSKHKAVCAYMRKEE